MKTQNDLAEARAVAASRASGAEGFSVIELLIGCLVLIILAGRAVKYVAVATQRSRAEQVKVDLTQEAREFVDEFERDVHQAGYPGCRMFNGYSATCIPGFISTTSPSPMTQSSVAMGLVYVSNTE